MSWEKIGITIVARPASTGGALKVTIPKNIVEAYDLWTALKVEVKLERALKPQADKETRET